MKHPKLAEHVNLRMMPGQRDRIAELLREYPERWTYEAEFLRGAVHHFLLLFEKKEPATPPVRVEFCWAGNCHSAVSTLGELCNEHRSLIQRHSARQQ